MSHRKALKAAKIADEWEETHYRECTAFCPARITYLVGSEDTTMTFLGECTSKGENWYEEVEAKLK